MSLNTRITLLVGFACAAALAACATEEPDQAENEGAASVTTQVDVVQVQSGETMLRLGQVLAIELDSNASTGYGWEIVEDGSPQLEPAPVPASALPQETTPPMLGASGKSHWRFKAVQAGDTQLRLVYRRAWEKEVAPARIAEYKVRVE